LKKTLFIIALPLLLSACAANMSRPDARENTAQAAPAAEQDGALEKQLVSESSGSPAMMPAAEDPLPTVALSEELLFKLLSAEIAYQRNDWQTAYVTILTLAQQTGDPRLARRAAEVAHSVNRTEEALSAVRLWLTLAPNSEEAIQDLVTLSILDGRLAEVRPVLEQRLSEARPQTRGLMAFQLQRLLARATDKVAAFGLLEQVLKPYLDMPEAHLALAHAAFAAGDIQRAQQEAETALKTAPDSELAILTLAQTNSEPAKATEILTGFLSHYPKAREVRIALARLLVEQKLYDRARSEFETLLKEQPGDLTSLYALGVLAVHTNDFDGAEKHLISYLDILSKNTDGTRDPTQALLLLAQIAEERKDSKAVLKWLEQIEPGEAYLNAQIKRAQVMAKRGDLAEARKVLHESTANGEQEQSLLIIAESQLLRDAGQLPEAMKVFETGLERFPSNTDLLYDYAMLAEKGRHWNAMEESLRKIMKIAPENQHAYNALGYSLAERGIRLQEAYELIAKALKLAPSDPFIMDSMGWVQFRLGKLEEAEIALRRAYALRPDPEIAAHLGEVLWVKGEKEDAQKLWRDAQMKDPQNDTLQDTLARLNVSL
jgi:tetratricopeptide (TPR) repeat protein